MTDKKTFTWFGQSSEELSREELLEVIYFLAKERDELRLDRNKWMRHGDVACYLLDKEN